MYIFRPVRGWLYDAMAEIHPIIKAEAKTFRSKEDMEKYLSKHYDYGPDKTSGFLYERVGGQNAPASASSDDRIGWNNIHYVLYHGVIIGHCSDDFDPSVWDKKAKEYMPC